MDSISIQFNKSQKTHQIISAKKSRKYKKTSLQTHTWLEKNPYMNSTPKENLYYLVVSTAVWKKYWSKLGSSSPIFGVKAKKNTFEIHHLVHSFIYFPVSKRITYLTKPRPTNRQRVQRFCRTFLHPFCGGITAPGDTGNWISSSVSLVRRSRVGWVLGGNGWVDESRLRVFVLLIFLVEDEDVGTLYRRYIDLTHMIMIKNDEKRRGSG